MKMKHILVVISTVAIAFFSSCSTNKHLVKVSGTVKELQMSTFQYGTHTIKDENAFYALKSTHVDLGQYSDKEVTVFGEKVEGYPLSGGPVLLEVVKVK